MSTSSKIFSVRVPILWLEAWKNAWDGIGGKKSDFPTFNHFVLAMIGSGVDVLQARGIPKTPRTKKKGKVKK